MNYDAVTLIFFALYPGLWFDLDPCLPVHLDHCANSDRVQMLANFRIMLSVEAEAVAHVVVSR